MQRQALLERVKQTLWIGKSGHASCTRTSHGVATPRSTPEAGRAGAAPRSHRWAGHMPQDRDWQIDDLSTVRAYEENCSRGLMVQLQQSQIGESGDRTQKPVADEACRSVPYWYSL